MTAVPSATRIAERWSVCAWLGSSRLARSRGIPTRQTSDGLRGLGSCDRLRQADPDKVRVVQMESAILLKTVRMLRTCNARVGFSLRMRLMTDVAGLTCLLIPNNRGQGCG
jgi:hypothetical protein